MGYLYKFQQAQQNKLFSASSLSLDGRRTKGFSRQRLRMSDRGMHVSEYNININCVLQREICLLRRKKRHSWKRRTCLVLKCFPKCFSDIF